MAHLQYPLLGDAVYGGRARLPAGVDERLLQRIRNFRRQALHAEQLSFTHPASGEAVSYRAPPPTDFTELLDDLVEYD